MDHNKSYLTFNATKARLRELTIHSSAQQIQTEASAYEAKLRPLVNLSGTYFYVLCIIQDNDDSHIFHHPRTNFLKPHAFTPTSCHHRRTLKNYPRNP